jgi:amino acid transporter
MADTSDRTSREHLGWLKANVLVALTILGVLLYAVFSIPATYFYARLGTSPSEVGFTYASILSGSTLGALLILGCFLLLAFYLAYVVFALIAYLLMFRVAFSYLLHPKILLAGDQKLTADQFERKLRIIRKQYGKDQETWEQVETMLQRKRALKLIESPTSAEKLEIKNLNSKIVPLWVASKVSWVKRILRPRVWYIYALFLFLIAATVLLTIIAQVQADEVLKGETAVTGSQLGLFGYHVERVRIESIGPGNEQDIQRLAGKQVYLLGQNAQYVIVYIPEQRLTVRIPTTDVIVTSTP